MTDRVVYETEDKPTYVIQFELENGEWLDDYNPPFRSLDAAIGELDTRAATPYSYRIVERTK